ncbi:hypothetical protein, conserved [Eimeria praecox]|uniref:Uncharacterized protein n=1 Tax=Eimeria praecox TaxID=51316 RepID=U6GZR1_9EIME|nr:hypothetical protein, conserved [Eimeria praecox]
MGGAASTAGGGEPQGSASARPEEEWVLENVLFFDPTKQATQREGALATYKGPTVRRFTPSRAKLRNRNFRVFFTIEGRRQEYLLKLLNDPVCRILLCDRSGRELKEIRTSHIKYIQRQDVVHFFGAKTIAKARPLELRERSKSSEDSDGDYDSQEERRRENARMKARRKPQPLQRRTGCPLHGNQACRCAVERPTLDFLKNKKYGSDSSEEENEAAINARHASRYPVAIDGPCECGKEVRLNDIAARGSGRIGARVVEWFVANKQGKDPSFPINCEAVGQAFRLGHRHNQLFPKSNACMQVGKFIQVRASRRLEVSDGSPFVYSLAIKGPVTVDDETARAMLLMLTKKETDFEATCKGQDLQRLFGLSPVAVGNNQPFFDVTVTVTRQALQLCTSLPSLEAPLVLQMNYNAFFVSMLSQEELDEREEDLRLRIHFPTYR